MATKKKEQVDLGKAYFDYDRKIMKEIAELSWLLDPTGTWTRKWELIEKLNVAYDKLPLSVRATMHGFAPRDTGKTTLNESAQRASFYKKEIDKGVYGKDLIQPLDEKGKPNPEFVEHYGVANYSPEHKEYIRDTMGRDPRREKDWRANQK